MNEIAAMRTFVRVIQSGSFSAAARETGLGQPAISKQVTALETQLGAQLLRRTSRSLSLTEAGHDFYDSALRLLDDLDSAMSRIGQGERSPRGLIRVTTAPVFARLAIVPHLPGFFARFPGISLDFVVTERTLNLVEAGIDLAIHNGPWSDPSCIVKPIATSSIVTVGSAAFLAEHGEPSTPDDLGRFPCVLYARNGAPRHWSFASNSRQVQIRPNGQFRTDDADHIRAAVLSGLGLAHTPAWLFAPEIASGTVRVVLRDYQPDPLAISVVTLAGRRAPTRLRVFLDFLSEILPPALEQPVAQRRGGANPR